MIRTLLGLSAVVLLALSLAVPASAEVVPMREWLRDIEKLQAEVLQPLTEEFASGECNPNFGFHSDRYLRRLQAIRAEINSISYLLFREMMLITAEDVGKYYGPHVDSGICQQWQPWDGILLHVENKIEFIGNVFAMTGWE